MTSVTIINSFNLQELDKQWRIRVETIIRAKSIKGYNTRAGKVTENKFQLDIEKFELVEDWDQRFVSSTLSKDESGRRLTVQQVAEKDQVKSNQNQQNGS